MASCALSPALVHNPAIRRSLTLTPAAPHQTPTSTSGPRRSPQAPMRRRGAPQAATAEPAPHIRRLRFSEIFRDSQRFSKKPPKTNGEISRKTFRAAARIARQKNSQRFSRRVISTAAWIGSLISVHFFGFQRFSEIFRDFQRFSEISKKSEKAKFRPPIFVFLAPRGFSPQPRAPPSPPQPPAPPGSRSQP